ncbi:DEAD/DEAH box helicase [uncultured Tateyamaria sp.]|uniref:DEAD/DEAH box helicase n=1 Tax=uncultured Tateyamaria sp. TaxID=455651 RepID=UPI002603797B|nr:DEAD/DEAH box helicase [uncultured Tateyamaria sp.]
MLSFDYVEKQGLALLRWSEEDAQQKWQKLIMSICLEASDAAELNSSNALTLPWWTFLAVRGEVLSVISAFGLKAGADFGISEQAVARLNESRKMQESFLSENAQNLNEGELKERLEAVGFQRELTTEQVRNVTKLIARSSGATFSVPGAGKTTEALAFFALTAEEGTGLLVVAPKNAFAAWDEQYSQCFPGSAEKFERLRKTDQIPRQLSDNPKFMLIGYQQLVRVRDRVAEHISRTQPFVFLDESHRIKNIDSQQSQSILTMSHLPKGKLILSGTPMPQSTEDLVPQFRFLFPEISASAENVVDRIQRVYVRTSKDELGLRPPLRKVIPLPMDPHQEKLYSLLKSELAREAERALSDSTKGALRRFGRSVATVLQFVSNPALLADKPEFRYASELTNSLSEGEGPKIRYVIGRTRELTKQGHKVLIWSSFVKNVEYLSECLRDLGAVYIHGGVDAGSDEDEDTREGKIKKFHDDAHTQVMIANPAAASEGISLHRVCHHAIYLDRNFNAAQYLQSEDRIHRLGLPPDTATTLEVVECQGTVDETVRIRLESKVSAMAQVLRDHSLRISPVWETEEMEQEVDSAGLDKGDVEALVEALSPK